jgi:hypothetical protein
VQPVGSVSAACPCNVRASFTPINRKMRARAAQSRKLHPIGQPFGKDQGESRISM